MRFDKLKFDKKFVLLIGIASGILAAVFTVSYIEGVKKSILQGFEPVKVVIAKRDMKEGDVVEEDDIGVRYFPKRYLHPMVVKPGEVPLIVGQRLRNPIFKGHPVLWSDMGEGGKTGKLSEALLENERALSISVDAISSVSGLIRPGDHIDLLWLYSGPFPDGRGGTFVRTLLQNITVLAVGGSTSPRSAQGYSTITLSLSAEEAEIVTFAQYKGKIILTLRNRKDISTIKKDENVNLSDLFGERIKKVQKERTLRVIKGR